MSLCLFSQAATDRGSISQLFCHERKYSFFSSKNQDFASSTFMFCWNKLMQRSSGGLRILEAGSSPMRDLLRGVSLQLLIKILSSWKGVWSSFLSQLNSPLSSSPFWGYVIFTKKMLFALLFKWSASRVRRMCTALRTNLQVRCPQVFVCANPWSPSHLENMFHAQDRCMSVSRKSGLSSLPNYW